VREGVGRTSFRMNPQFLQAISSELPPTGAPFSSLTADEGPTDNGPLRGWLEEQGIAYVLTVARDLQVGRAGGAPRGCAGPCRDLVPPQPRERG
jgi:hypothetical protein